VALHQLDLKAFGERIAARDPDRQTAEIHNRVALINRFNALGTAEVVRVAGHQRRKGHHVSSTTDATTPWGCRHPREGRILSLACAAASDCQGFNIAIPLPGNGLPPRRSLTKKRPISSVDEG
jgi:hypothetical protein